MDINPHHYQEREEVCQKSNERKAYCRCWQSKKFPLCDGSHRAFNAEHDCALGPIIIHGEAQD